MRVMGIAGRSGMGKTTLLGGSCRCSLRAGLRVSLKVKKHSHKDIGDDRPGRTAGACAGAGCQECCCSARPLGADARMRGDPEPPCLPARRLQHCDLVLVRRLQGRRLPSSKSSAQPMVPAPLWPEWPGIAAVASRWAAARLPLPVLALEDTAAQTRLHPGACGPAA